MKGLGKTVKESAADIAKDLSEAIARMLLEQTDQGGF